MLTAFKRHPADHDEIKPQKNLGDYGVILLCLFMTPKVFYTSKGLSFENTTDEIWLQLSILLNFAGLWEFNKFLGQAAVDSIFLEWYTQVSDDCFSQYKHIQKHKMKILKNYN